MKKLSRKERRLRRQAEQREAREFERAPGNSPVMAVEERKALEVVAQALDEQQRKAGADESRQPRFSEPQNLFTSVVRWASYCALNEPSSRAPIREWDIWYRDFSRQEPFLAGCLSSAVQIDKNRGWTLTGGRNQVAQYTRRLHAFAADTTGVGWRPHVEWLSQSFYCTQMGFVAEVGSQGRDGPLNMMWAVDPCRCTLTGHAVYPLDYSPRVGATQHWQYGTDFLRGCSQKSTAEEKFGYGFPAVARCYALAKIMAGVYRHYQMKTGITTPDGILAHNAMSDDQWQKALEIREQELLHNPDDYLNKIISVGNPGGEVPEFVLTILSSLPDRFDIEQWTQILMRGYQLAFGYGAGEFYPESYGVIGRGKEQEQQHRTGTGKGGKDFSLTHSEQLQSRLPATLEFGYEERDVTGEIEDAQLAAAKAAVITEVNKWTTKNGGVETSVLTAQQILQLAAEAGVVPEEWTPQDEDVTATDEEAPDTERIYRALREFPNEPIVRYSSRTNTTRTLLSPRRTVFAVPQLRSVNEVVREYRNALTRMVYDTYRTGNAVDMRRSHRALLRALAEPAFTEGLKEGGTDASEMDDDDREQIANWLSAQLGFVNDFAAAVVGAASDEAQRATILSRIELWVESVRELGSLGEMSAQKNAMLTLDGEAGKKQPCDDCRRLKGVRHRAKWWIKNGLVPKQGNPHYECGNWEGCHHFLRRDDGTRFDG